MPIKRKVYLELKAMYDFQRKKEYNKEKLKKAIDMIKSFSPPVKSNFLQISFEECNPIP